MLALARRLPAAILGEWADPSTSAMNVQWVREVAAATERFSTGSVYVNCLAEEGEERIKAPTNFFHLKQNIEPTA